MERKVRSEESESKSKGIDIKKVQWKCLISKIGRLCIFIYVVSPRCIGKWSTNGIYTFDYARNSIIFYTIVIVTLLVT